MKLERSGVAALIFTVENRLNFCCDRGICVGRCLTMKPAGRSHVGSLTRAVGIGLESSRAGPNDFQVALY